MTHWTKGKLNQVWVQAKEGGKWVLVGSIAAASALGLLLTPADQITTTPEPVGVAVLDCTVTPDDAVQAAQLLAGKNASEKAELQAKRVHKIVGCKMKEAAGLEPFYSEEQKAWILIRGIQKGPSGYVRVRVQAWDDKGNPYGFGDGTVEIETINIQRPPLLAWDGTATLTDFVDNETGEKYPYEKKNYIEDPIFAFEQRVARIVGAVKKPGNSIIAGKIGQTTTSCVPDANPETNTVDGFANHLLGEGSGVSWGTLVAAAGTNARDDTNGEDTIIGFRSDSGSGNWREIDRGIFLVDCSAIPDTDNISAVSFIINGVQRSDAISITPDVNIYSSAPATNTAIVAGDFDSLGTTAYATSIPWASWTAAGDNTFTFNATGIAAVSKTGVTKLGARNEAYDAANSSPTWSGSALTFININFAAGNANDPELVVTHAAGAAVSNRKVIRIE